MILRILKILALLILFFFVVGITAYFTLTLFIKSEDTVIIPELTGKEVVNALEILSNMGLNTKVKGSEYSAEIPKNHIIFQEPEAGEEIKKGRDVKIVISKGDKTLLTPNMKGLSIEQARIVLEENELIEGSVSGTYDDSIKKDDIIYQHPLPGTLINRSRKVDLLLSLGHRPNEYKMPDLTGLSIEEAILLVEKNSFSMGEIKTVYTEALPKNVITEQDPPSGYPILEGGRVNLTLNRDPEKKSPDYSRGLSGIRLFRYHVGPGFLKRHLKARLNCFGISNIIYDDLVKPGKDVWLLIPNNSEALFVYENDELIKTWEFDN